MKLLLLCLLFFSCSQTQNEVRYLPDTLPSEDAVKQALSSDANLLKLRNIANAKGMSLEDWKEREKVQVTEAEISSFWKSERKILHSENFDTDAIDRGRQSIRMRLVWSRIFNEAGILWRESSKPTSLHLISKLDLKLSPKIGVSKPKWVVVEWSDFFCTFCKQTYPHTQKILNQYKNQITYYHKDYPLEAESSKGLVPLAVSRCLWEKEPSQYFSKVMVLYEQVKSISNGDFLGLGNCNPKNLDEKYLERVRSDYMEAVQLGITSIPTFWVNGRWIVGSLDDKSWARLLRETSPK